MNPIAPTRSHPLPHPAPLPSALWLDWVGTFVVAMCVYVATCSPDVHPGDSAVLQLRAVRFPSLPAELIPDGLVHVHPLYLALTKAFTLIPVGNCAYRVNLASAFFGAVALAGLFATVRVLTGSRWAATIGTMSAGLGHTFWAFSTVAECLTLVAAFLMSELLALAAFARTGRKRWFMLAAILNGLSISNHMMGALTTPVYVLLALTWRERKRLRTADLLASAVLWLVGAAAYLQLVVRAMIQIGDIPRIIRSATSGGWPAANLDITPALAIKVAAWLLMQYPTLLLVLAFLSMRVQLHHRSDRSVRWAILGTMVVHFIFAARYPVPDQYSFFTACYAAMGVLIGLGSWHLIHRLSWTKWALVALAGVPVAVYVALPSLMRRYEPKLFTAELALPEPYLAYVDPYVLFFRPWQQNNHGTRRYTDDVLHAVPKNAVLVADYVCGMPIQYVRTVENQRPDLQVLYSQHPFPFETLLKAPQPGGTPQWSCPIYALGDRWPHVPAALKGFRFVREGVVYRIEPPPQWPIRR